MKVKSIEPAGVARTYDLTVADHHNFIVNGQVVHNCLKDISRVMDVPYAAVNEVTASIIERSSGDERASQTIEDSFKEFKVCQDFNKKYPEVLPMAKKLEGMSKNLGMHAAGVVCSPVPLTDMIPLEIRKHDNQDVIVTAGDMYAVAASGLVKLDVLGLRTLSVLKGATDMIKERHGVEVDLEKLDLNDKEVLKGFTDHEYVGIFQYDSPGADKICAGVEFVHFEDIAAMTALNRPGTARSGLATQYIERKKDPEKVKETAFHQKVTEITADTLGIIVYQEHVLKIFTEVAGFAPATADSLRKTIAKKIGDETLGKERAHFIEGAMKLWGPKGAKGTGMTEKLAGKIMDAITFFGCVPVETVVATPSGGKTIAELNPGDKVWSYSHSGLVENTVSGAGKTGEKELFRIETDRGCVYGSADHWWLLDSGEYKKTRDLCLGDFLSYATPYEAKKEVFDAGLRRASFLSDDVYGALSDVVQGTEDSMRPPSGQRVFSAPGRGQGLEGGTKQGQLPGDGVTGEENHRGEKSIVERRAHPFIPESSGVVVCERGHVRKMRVEPRGEAIFDACAPQGQKQKEQPSGEFGTVVCELPHGRAQRGEAGSGARITAKVKWVEAVGAAEMADIEVENEPHNYVLQSGFVSHNSYGFNKSHATAYGVIAYWGMWLKVHYPVEFYWSLLKHEPTRIRVQAIAKDAKKHGIELLPPDVSVSGAQFTIDPSGKAIRGSLVDIKGVGVAASSSVMENQPYKDFWDFLERVDGRKVHKGVLLALAKAGALDNMLPNVKWFIERIDKWWPLYTKNKETRARAVEILEKTSKLVDYSPEERGLIAAAVNPLAFGKHPVDAYGDFISKHVKVPIVDMSHEDFWKDNDGKGVFIVGVIVETKYNQIGDFHTGELPPERERKMQFWGKRYANVNVEDPGGVQNRIKFDIDIFEDMRAIVDAGIGTPVVVHASVNGKYQNLRAHFAVDMETYRKKIESGGKLNIWERILDGKHPVAVYPWKKNSERRISNELFKNYANGSNGKKGEPPVSQWMTGVVTHVKLKYDKKGNLMSFFGLIGADGFYVDSLCFASVWDKEARKTIKPGATLKIQLDRGFDSRTKGWSFIFGHDCSFQKIPDKG